MRRTTIPPFVPFPDALDPDRHDRFRKVRGAWRNTVEGAEILNTTGLPFIVQTTAGSHNLGELDAIADFAHERLAAKVWNLYFLVPTGRGQFVSDITPAQYDEVLASLYRIQRKYDRRMLVNAKCAPHYIKTVLESASGLREGPEGSPAERDPRAQASGGAVRRHSPPHLARRAMRGVRDERPTAGAAAPGPTG
jgi:MoaA/NifB/PqqE/SkfB family radical SAM enzyme